MNSNLFSLKDKLAVISGGGSGIGYAIAGYLAKAGAKVILVGRNTDTLNKSVHELQQLSFQADFYSTDLSKETNMINAAKDIIKKFGSVDIVVNAAGINQREHELDITYESWNQTIDINLKAPFFFTREFTHAMKKKKQGKIINIASLQSVRAFENGLAYGASKGGVMQLTRAMAESYSSYGINVNAIGPGFFKTDLTSKVYENEEKVDSLARQTAIGRNGIMEDFEGIAIFLASDASNYITGQTIFLDGGFTAK
jgi:NAD(P)-dependent dehydrogenase (short-subunit alcohol dehydrogenase family)